jgi:hypothetical protein
MVSSRRRGHHVTRRSRASILAAAALLAMPCAGQDPTELGSVDVESSRRNPRINEQVSEFVTAIVPSTRHESLSRWSVPVCPAAAGLTGPEVEFVEKRIGAIAAEAGIPVGPPGCAPNFAVIVTSDPEAFLREWWKAEPRLFNKDRGVGGVERVIRTEQPVRVWHNVCNVPPSLARNFHMNVAWDCNAGGELGSRITRAVVRSIYTAFIVVDFDHIQGMTFGQVTDYVAMVGLAQLRTDEQLRDDAHADAVPTILTLFRDGGADRVTAMTDWDRAFLKSAYASRDGSVTELTQIKLKMTEQLAR